MLERGDVIVRDTGNAKDKGVNFNTYYVVLDSRSPTVLAALVQLKKSAQRFEVQITKDDIQSGEAELSGFVQIDQIFSLEQANCKRIGSINSHKLEEVLRTFTKYAASTHFNSFHQSKSKKFISPSGKVIDEKDLFALLDASLDMWLTAGRFSKAFETTFPKKMNMKYCSLVNSGSSANLLALYALTSWKLGDKKVKLGDEVITVASAFPTTVAPIIQNGLIPVFLDVEIGTYNFQPEALENAISEKTSVIFMAHTLGNPFDVDKVREVAEKYDLWFIEDNCDSLGSEYKNRLTGTFGDEATFSFYPAHHITMGEGGAVVTNDPQLNEIVCSIRDWGRDCWCNPGVDNSCGKRFEWKLGTLPEGYDHKYIYSHLGFNLKATDFQAAIGLSQLEKMEEFIEKRRNNFKLLYSGFKKLALDQYFQLPKWLPNSNPSWFGFPLTINQKAGFKRKKLLEFLEKKGIGSRLLFAGNMLRQPAFTNANFDYKIFGKLENTDTICENTFWIGVWPGISARDIEYVLDTFELFIEQEAH
jgi:CDP-4-dehydro-6-deoxyglucose reductase, E1